MPLRTRFKRRAGAVYDEDVVHEEQMCFMRFYNSGMKFIDFANAEPGAALTLAEHVRHRLTQFNGERLVIPDTDGEDELSGCGKHFLRVDELSDMYLHALGQVHPHSGFTHHDAISQLGQGLDIPFIIEMSRITMIAVKQLFNEHRSFPSNDARFAPIKLELLEAFGQAHRVPLPAQIVRDRTERFFTEMIKQLWGEQPATTPE